MFQIEAVTLNQRAGVKARRHGLETHCEARLAGIPTPVVKHTHPIAPKTIGLFSGPSFESFNKTFDEKFDEIYGQLWGVAAKGYSGFWNSLLTPGNQELWKRKFKAGPTEKTYRLLGIDSPTRFVGRSR